ncbi:hypothetical protein GUJ93_ZPchr0004g39423 [Zizania palustris]|uniref:Uncharacterized protein n=1 Tax=Zizania palustris TaxID=103762 RepID=A0A8J5SB17_ZIZPA|nr:hypothetical protein GUJ93_ZPchr0004g39423 [Zizania palustris]
MMKGCAIEVVVVDLMKLPEHLKCCFLTTNLRDGHDIGCRAGKLRELRAADVDVSGDGVEVVEVGVGVTTAVVVCKVWDEMANTEDDDDHGGRQGGAVVGNLGVAVRVGVSREGDGEECKQ